MAVAVAAVAAFGTSLVVVGLDLVVKGAVVPVVAEALAAKVVVGPALVAAWVVVVVEVVVVSTAVVLVSKKTL